MMKDIEIKINRETRMVDLSKSIIGNDGENLQGNLVFSFTDEFVKGQARLEYVIDDEKKYALLLKDEDNYYIPIKSVMTKEGQIDMQLVITEGTNENEIPIFKSNIFYVTCKKSINAEIEEEEEYYSWIEIANTKLNEVDEAIEELASQSNYAKEQGDYAKEQGTNAKNVADDTQKKAEEGKFNGKSLEFIWQGTKLGVRLEGQEEYQFVDLQGKQGEIGATGEPFKIKKTYASVSEMNADFRNMEFGDYVMIASSVDVEDNAKLYTRGESAWIFISDFSGAMGIRGETGLTPNIKIGEVKTLEAGSQAKVTRSGSNEEPVFNFELPKGDKGDNYVLTEEDKVEIGEKVNTEYEKRIAENEKDIIDIESYLDNLTPKATAKGELVHITDALPLATFENTISGNVKQEGEPSPTSPQEIEVLKAYNLLNITTFTDGSKEQIKNGVTATINDDGTITCKGTATDQALFYLTKNDLDFTLGDGYFLCNSPSANQRVEFNCSTDGTEKYLNSYGTGNFINAKTSFIFKNAYIIIAKGENVDVTFKPMFAKGTIQKPYLPYGCVGVKVSGKNKANIDKNYTFTGLVDITDLLDLTPNTDYIISCKSVVKGGSEFPYVRIGDRFLSLTGENEWSFTTGDTKGNCYIYSNGTSASNSAGTTTTVNELMIRLATITDNIYEPYQEQIVPLDLKGNWVGAINDSIKDYLVTDKKKYWLVKNVGKVVLDGSEEWIKSNFSTGESYYQLSLNIGQIISNVKNTVLCTHFIEKETWSKKVVGIYFDSKMIITTNDSLNNTETIDDFKTFLSENKPEVYYQLATPEIIELGELPEPIKTFEGVNNIQLLANLDTEIEVKYALDLKKYYDNKLAEISAQII